MLRDYNVGDLKMRSMSIEDQLKHPENEMIDGQLYLGHCRSCNKENYYACVPAGSCCWCNWPTNREEVVE